MIVFQHLICVVPECDFFTSCEAREIAPRNSEGLTHLHELQNYANVHPLWHFRALKHTGILWCTTAVH